MVKGGLAHPGALTANLPPLSVGSALAIAAWNRAAPDFRLPDYLLALACDEIDDWDLMLMRLDVLRAETHPSRAKNHVQ